MRWRRCHQEGDCEKQSENGGEHTYEPATPQGGANEVQAHQGRSRAFRRLIIVGDVGNVPELLRHERLL